MGDDQIKAAAEDAARQLGYRLVATGMRVVSRDERAYSFRFGGEDVDLSVEFVFIQSAVLRSGLTPREYARLEILDALTHRES
jgi:hypothetical protein